MRISVRKADPGYHPMAVNGGFKITVDGTDVTALCHTADEEEGRVWGYALNEDGHKYVDQATGFAAECIMSGEVEIISMMNGARVYAQPC